MFLFISAVLFCLAPQKSLAAPFNPTTFSIVTDEMLSDLGALVGLGADLHAYEGAQPYSSEVGFDIGASATAVQIPGKMVDALTKLGIPNVPKYLPIPKVNIQKAAPGRLLFGAEFLPTVKIGGNRLSIYGFNIQWLAIDRPRLPFIAIRGQFNYSSLVFVNAATYGADVVVSNILGFVHTYAGAGYRYVRASITNPTATTPYRTNLNFDPTLDAGHFFAGVSIPAGFFRLTAEADITTRKVNTYGTKISFFF